MKNFVTKFLLITILGLVNAVVLLTFAPLNAQTAPDRGIAPSSRLIRPVLIGDSLPNVSVATIEGKTVSLRTICSKPTVLIFYRGGWCPYCSAQLGQLNEIEDSLLTIGYQIVAVSADRPSKLRESLEKSGVGYGLFSDSSMTAARALGIAFQVDSATVNKYVGYGIDLVAASGETHHVLPVPSVFLVDAAGVIKFTYINPDYRIRIKPQVLLVAAKAELEK